MIYLSRNEVWNYFSMTKDKMAIEWFDIYKVDVKEIDLQHKYFVGLLNKLYMAAKEHETVDMDKFLDEIAKYADLHFETEERYFDKFIYENAEEHKEEHRKLRSEIDKFLAKNKGLTENKEALCLELLEFMENWLQHHLVEQDRKYVKCFHENGVK